MANDKIEYSLKITESISLVQIELSTMENNNCFNYPFEIDHLTFNILLNVYLREHQEWASLGEMIFGMLSMGLHLAEGMAKCRLLQDNTLTQNNFEELIKEFIKDFGIANSIR